MISPASLLANLSDVPEVITLGHNFTPTTDTLPQGRFTVGTYAAAYGVTDWLMIGTSPWIITNYNMPMVSLRFGHDLVPDRLRLGFDFNYFHSVPMLMNGYDQKSTYTRLTLSQKYSQTYQLHLSVSHQAYLAGTRFFSLRLYAFREYDGDPPHDFNITASSLHELHFSKSTGLFLELGLSGVNYQTNFTLLGASVFWKIGGFLLQAGLSYTLPNNPIDTDSYASRSIARFHPEMQLQFFP